mgnify:CR=1 FL=1
MGDYESFGNYISKPFCTVTLSEQAVRERFNIENLLSDTATLATGIQVLPHSTKIQTGKDNCRLTAKLFRHCGQNAGFEKIKWRIQPGFEQYAKIEGTTIVPTNQTDTVRTFYVEAYTESGLVGATEVTVEPSVMPSPAFTRKPSISTHNGIATVNTETCEAIGMDLEAVQAAFAPLCTQVLTTITGGVVRYEAE